MGYCDANIPDDPNDPDTTTYGFVYSYKLNGIDGLYT